ncbi:MAG: protein kinase, partial [Deltaproteobacteria bacterium]|nr:protein kinase [Deltaproteobacteria bacterium]
MTSSVSRPPSDLLADRYELYRELGEGTVAHTYLGLEHGPLGLRRLTTIKLLKPDIHHDALRLEGLFAAARRLAASDTPHLVEVRDMGAQGGEAFIAFPYLVGENLLSILARCAQLGEPPPLAITRRIAADAAAGLTSLHQSPPETTGPPLHGALRPSNILVAHTGLSHVLDAGIASNTQALMARGSISPGIAQFTSPESLSERRLPDEELDLTTDLYALAACLYALVTLRFPFDEMQLEALVVAKQHHAGVPASQRQRAVPSSLESFLTRTLSPSPGMRPQSAAELADELRAVGANSTHAIADHATVARWLRKVFGEPFANKMTFLRALISPESHALPSAAQTQVQAPQAPTSSTKASRDGHESPRETSLEPFGEDESLGDFDEEDTEMIVSKDDTTALPPPDEQAPANPF